MEQNCRNKGRLIHAYFVVDYKLVWKTLEEELPGLKERLAMLQIEAENC